MLTQEVVENPMLEEVPTEDLQAADAIAQTEREDPQPEAQPARERQLGRQRLRLLLRRLPRRRLARQPRPGRGQGAAADREHAVDRSARSADHLSGSSRSRPTILRSRDIGLAIIGNLGDDGYLMASVDEIAAMGDWNPADVEPVLTTIQHFDPVGVAARDLQECLTLQLRHLGLSDTPAERIVTDHLRLLQNHQVPEIARRLAMTIEELKPHIEIIRHLDPKPGRTPQSLALAVRDPGRLRRQGRGSVRGDAERRWIAAAAHQPDVQAADRQGHRRRTTRPRPTSRRSSGRRSGCSSPSISGRRRSSRSRRASSISRRSSWTTASST